MLYGIDKSDHTDTLQRNSMFTEFIPRLLRCSEECTEKFILYNIKQK